MNSDQLYYLIEISKSVSLSDASQKLHISTQALSQAIKKLEDEMGFELLNRSFKGVSLTINGEWLVNEATEFLNKIELRKEQYLYKKNSPHKGTLTIGINNSGINDNIIGELIVALENQETELEILLHEYPKEMMFDAVRNNDVEFGFIFRTKVNGVYIDEIDKDLHFEALFCGNLVVSTAEHTEIANSNSITLKKVVQYPICAYNPLKDAKDYLHYLLTDVFNFTPMYKTETNFSVFKQKIKHGTANAISVHFQTELNPNNYIEKTKIIQIRDDVKVYFGFIRKRDIPLTNNGVFFLQELRGMIYDLKCSGE